MWAGAGDQWRMGLMRTEGARVLVTGAARRVGRAIALELAGAGCDVVVHCHQSQAEARNVVEKIRRMGRQAALVQADLGFEDSVRLVAQRSVENLGGLDVLVNNAAVFDGDERVSGLCDWRRVFGVNVFAPAILVEQLTPALRAGGGGKVVNLCDISAERPWPTHAAYCASKSALVSLTRAWARRLAPDIQVNGVAPGIAEFPADYPADVREKLIARVPLRRAGSPRDIASTVRFLIEHGDYITGQIINVDGGRSIR